jgi:hypothetical protein
MKIYCCCCAKQIVQYDVRQDDKYVTCGPVIAMGFGKVCCKFCSKDLDENGLFPEERRDI